MPTGRQGLVWAGRCTAFVVVAALVTYWAVAGLARASAVASVLGAIVAVAALVLPHLAPNQSAPASLAPNPSAPASLADATVLGSVSQRRHADGASNGLAVERSWIGGDLTQVDGDPPTR